MGVAWVPVVLSLADMVSPLCSVGVAWARVVFPVVGSLSLSWSVSVTGACVLLSLADVVSLTSSESWAVVVFCEVVLTLVLVFTGLTGAPEFLVALVLLVVDLQTVVLLGAEADCSPSEPFSVLVDWGSSAERPFRIIGSCLWWLVFFSTAGGIS